MFFSEGAQTQIVPELLIPLNDNNKILVIFIKSPISCSRHRNLRIPNPQYLQLNCRYDFFNDSENTF